MANEELENLETAPKKKRGRPSKAELAERERLKKLSEEQNAAEPQLNFAPSPETESQTAGDESAEGADAVPKRKRIRRTKAEIIAAAEATAAALAENNQKKADLSRAMEEEGYDVPEASFGVGESSDDDAPSMGLMERLQSKVNSQSGFDQPWEGAPADGTDFIIIQDIPVEDNAVIPYYDMFDHPNTVENTAVTYDDAAETDEGGYDFSDIIKANGLL